MKREIKFRGRCIKSNDWVYGDLIHGVGHKSGNLYILPNKINLASVKHCDPLDGVKVNPETVGQYTGIKDDNGTETYEGDIVNAGYAPSYELKRFEVKYGGASFFCYRKHENPQVQFEHLPLCPSNSMEGLEVIGNIYETPELLNQ